VRLHLNTETFFCLFGIKSKFKGKEKLKNKTMASSNVVSHEDGTKPAKRKPTFTKVDQMKPGTNGHTLIAKVLTSETVLQKGGGTRPSSSSRGIVRPTLISECLIGDETGTIIFTARNEQGSFSLLFMLF